MSNVTVPAMTIGGEPVGSPQTFDVVNPANGEPFAAAPECKDEVLESAFAAARSAFTAWSADEGARRALMADLADAIASGADDLTSLLVLETGKPTAIVGIELAACEMWLRYYAEMEIPSEVVAEDAQTGRIEVRRRPLGVVAGIIPWNFPLGSAVWKIAPAMRAGNTLVLKPSPFAPLAVLRLGEIVNEALPPGVVNVVSGGDELGAAMARHPVPRKISFTGSIAAGKLVAAAAAPDLKRLTLELGGNDAAVLLDDVDLAATAPAVLAAALFNTGQTCAIPKRIFVPDAIYDDAVDAFSGAAAAITLGAGAEGELGPLSTRPQFDRVRELVAAAVRDGATAAVGGDSPGGPGYFFAPTVLADAREGQRVVDEEQFGPVVPLLRYDDLDDALARANATMYGLCGSVWSADVERAARVAERLECGVAYVNLHGALPPPMPFGGAKWSGVGVENGLEGLLAQTERQVIYRPPA